MGILYALLFTNVLHVKKISPRKITKTVKRESKFWILLIKDILQLMMNIIRFVVNGISLIINLVFKKHICPIETVKKVKTKSDKIVDLTDYKLKKAK